MLRRSSWLIAAATAVGVVVAGCGGSNSSGGSTNSSGGAQAVSVDVGTSTPVKLKSQKLNIAYVASSMASPAGQIAAKNIKDVAAAHGDSVTVFDARFDPGRQFALYQNIVAGKKYNVLITLPINGDQSCNILSKQAPAAGILVTATTIPICGRSLKPYNQTWQPGTLASAGINSTVDANASLAEECAKQTGAKTVALINGAAGTPNFQAMTQGYQRAGFNIVVNAATDYTPEKASAVTAAALRAHPDIQAIATTSPLLTKGVFPALASAGKKAGRDVKVCQYYGGDAVSMAHVRSGELNVDSYQNNGWIAAAAMRNVVNAVTGGKVLHILQPGPGGQPEPITKAWPPSYTAATVSQYSPNGQ
jgi:ribose transport system substrate-binding protein